MNEGRMSAIGVSVQMDEGIMAAAMFVNITAGRMAAIFVQMNTTCSTRVARFTFTMYVRVAVLNFEEASRLDTAAGT